MTLLLPSPPESHPAQTRLPEEGTIAQTVPPATRTAAVLIPAWPLVVARDHLDRSAADRAARLVGNMPGTACLESVLGGLSLRAAGDQVLAVTGAAVELEVVPAPTPDTEPTDAAPSEEQAPVATDSADVPETEQTEPDERAEQSTKAPRVDSGWRPRAGLPFALKDGQTLRVGAPSDGLRVYVAVRGGIVDVFPTTADHPLRIEFDGDEIAEIRAFSVADQRSLPDGEVEEPTESRLLPLGPGPSCVSS